MNAREAKLKARSAPSKICMVTCSSRAVVRAAGYVAHSILLSLLPFQIQHVRRFAPSGANL